MSIDEWIKLLGVGGAIATFSWGVWVWRAERQHTAETRRVEATRPFLDRQLTLYTEATQVASLLSTSSPSAERARATQRFWQLYWGELALVESRAVESAMVQFGEALGSGASISDLQPLSLRLAHACRDSLAQSWGVALWASPSSSSSVPVE
jgi:hypothetical protein